YCRKLLPKDDTSEKERKPVEYNNPEGSLVIMPKEVALRGREGFTWRDMVGMMTTSRLQEEEKNAQLKRRLQILEEESNGRPKLPKLSLGSTMLPDESWSPKSYHSYTIQID
ncbi:unnamed protein product, partial [Symbiodinium sp. KB8]